MPVRNIYTMKDYLTCEFRQVHQERSFTGGSCGAVAPDLLSIHLKP